MIKAEVIFDEGKILINGKEVEVFAEYGYDTNSFVDNIEFDTLEQAISYCLQQPPK